MVPFKIVLIVSVLIQFKFCYGFQPSDLLNFDFSYRDHSLEPKTDIKNIRQVLTDHVERRDIRMRIRESMKSYLEEVKAVHGIHEYEDGHSLDTRRSKRDTLFDESDDHPSIRKRRDWNDFNPQDAKDKKAMVISTIQQINPPDFSKYSVRDIQIFRHEENTYICALLTSSNETEAVFYEASKNWEIVEVGRISAHNATSITIFAIMEKPFVAIASAEPIHHSTLNGGSVIYELHITEGTVSFVWIQNIQTRYTKRIAVWSLSGIEAKEVMLCAPPEKNGTGKISQYTVQIPCYTWQGAYFDQSTYPIIGHSPQAMHHVTIYSHDYICIANYRDSTGSTNIFSTIMQYSHKHKGFVVYQRLRTFGARDCRFFNFNKSDNKKDHYLVMVNEGTDINGKINPTAKTHIYKRGKTQFILLQTLPTVGAYKVTTIKDGDKFFMIISELYGLSFYQYNGWRFTKVREISFGDNFANRLMVHPFVWDSNSYFTIATDALSAYNGVYNVKFEGRNDYQTFSLDLQKQCNATLNKLQEVNTEEVVERAKSLPNSKDPEVVINKKIEFTSHPKVKNAVTQSFEINGTKFDAEKSRNLAKLGRQFDALETEMIPVKDQVAQAISLTESGQVVTTEIVMDHWGIDEDGGTLHVGNYSTEHINKIHVAPIIQHVVYQDNNYTFYDMSALKVMIADNDLKTGSINGHKTEHLFVMNAGHVQLLTGMNNFMGPVHAGEGFDAEKKVNDVDPDDILTYDGYQKFKVLRIKNGEVGNLKSDNVNDVNFDLLEKHACHKGEDCDIKGNKRFTSITCTDDFIVDDISDYSMHKVLSETFKMSELSREEYRGPSPLILEKLVCEELKLEDRLINGEFNFSRDFVNAKEGEYELDKLEITNNSNATHFRNLTVSRLLNDLRVGSVLLKNSTGSQTVNRIHLHSLILHQPSTLNGTINDLTAEQLVKTRTVFLNDTLNINNLDLSRYHVDFAGGLTVKTLNLEDQNYIDLIKNFVKTELTLPENCKPERIVFESIDVKKNLEVGSVNGIVPHRDLVVKNGENIIVNSTKDFLNGITLTNDCTASSLFIGNDWDFVKQMQHILLNNTDQSFPSSPRFDSVVNVQEITGNYLMLDGISPDWILRKSVDHQIVKVKSSFKQSMEIEALKVNGKTEVNMLNQHGFSYIVSDTFRSKTSKGVQTATGRMEFLEGLLVSECWSSGSVNGYSLDEIFRYIFYNKAGAKNGKILGSVTLTKPSNIKKMGVIGYVNHLSSAEWGTAWLTRDGDQEIFTEFHFIRPVHASYPDTFGSELNGVDLHDLNITLLRKHEDAVFEKLTLTDGGKFDEGLCATSVNGYDVLKDFVQKHNESVQVISGNKTFYGPWKVFGELVTELIAKHEEYEEFIERTKSSEPVDVVVTGTCHFQLEPLTDQINDVALREAFEKYWFNNRPTSIDVPLDFESMELGNATVNGLLCGIDIDELAANYLSRSKDQIWSGQFTFDGETDFNMLSARDTMLLQGKLNDFDVLSFNGSVLKQDEDQAISSPLVVHKFVAPSIEGTVNENDFCNDFITLTGVNHITVDQQIEKILADEIVLPNGFKVNDVDLSYWYAHATNTVDNFTLHGIRNFQKATFKQITLDRLNGRHVTSKDVLCKTGDQKGNNLTMYSRDEEPVAKFDKLIVQNELNKKSVSARMRSMVMDDGTKPLYMMGKNFKKNVKARSLVTSSKLYQNNADISEFLDNIHEAHPVTHNYTDLDERYSSLLGLSHVLEEVAEYHAVVTQCYELETIATVPNASFVFPSTVSRNHTVAVVSNNDGSSMVVWWSYGSGNEHVPKVIRQLDFNGNVRSIGEIKRRGEHYFIFAVSSSGEMVRLSTPTRFLPGSTGFFLDNKPDELSRIFVLVVRKDAKTGAMHFFVRHVMSGNDYGSLQTFTILSEMDAKIHCMAVSVSNVEDGSDNAMAIYCFKPLDTHRDDDNNDMSLVQTLPITFNAKFTTIEVENKTLLISCESVEAKDPPGTSAIYVWAAEKGEGNFHVEDLFHVYKCLNLDSIVALNHYAFLAIVSDFPDGSPNRGLVTVFRYDASKKQFQKYQTLETAAPSEVKFHRLDQSGELFLYVLSKACADTTLTVFSFKGASGWTEVNSIKTPKWKSLATHSVNDQHEFQGSVFGTKCEKNKQIPCLLEHLDIQNENRKL